MRWLLDTTVLIDASRRHEPAMSWIDDALQRPDDVGVCAVSISEFFAGIRPDDRLRWEVFVVELACLDITCEIAKRAGVYQYDFARRGRTIHTADALIAATAATIGAVIVTNNVRDFPMPDVTTLRLLT